MKKLNSIIAILIIMMISVSSIYSASPRKVIAEEWTGGACGWCAYYNPDYQAWLMANESWVVPITYESSTPFDSPNGGYRNYFYGNPVSGIPSVIANGVQLMSPPDVPAYLNSNFKNQTSPITILLFESRKDGQCTATITVHTDEALTDAKLFFAIIDEHINYPSATPNGETDFYFLERGMAPDGYNGINLDLEADEAVTYTVTFALSDVVYDTEDDIYCAAWVQKYTQTSAEVLQAEKTMDGSNLASRITTDVTTLSFGKTSEEITKTVTISNDDYRPINIEDIYIENDDDGAFEITSDFEGAVIGYKAKFEVDITFTPKQNKDYTAKLTIKSDCDTYPTKSVGIAGTGEDIEEMPILAFSTDMLDFGEVSESKTMDLTISNDGFADLEINEIVLNDNQSGAFEILTTDIPETVAPGADFTIEVKFTPKKNDSYLVTLEVDCNDEESNNTLVIKGEGKDVVVTVPDITTSLNTLSFGEVSEYKDMTFEITNTGQGELVISEMSIECDYDVFEITSQDAPALANGETHIVGVRFTPTENDDYTGFITIISNADNSPEKSITMLGMGKDVTPQPKLALSDESLDYGTVTGEKSNSLTIVNAGQADLEITNLRITGDDADVFEITSDTKIDAIAAGNQVDVEILFTPTDNRTFNAKLEFTSNVGGTSYHEVNLTGAGEGLSVEDMSTNDMITLSAGPNPFNEIVKVNYEIHPATMVPVNISVYDALGHKITTLVEDNMANGSYNTQFNGSSLSNGIYYIVANVGGKVAKLQVVLVK